MWLQIDEARYVCTVSVLKKKSKEANFEPKLPHLPIKTDITYSMTLKPWPKQGYRMKAQKYFKSCFQILRKFHMFIIRIIKIFSGFV